MVKLEIPEMPSHTHRGNNVGVNANDGGSNRLHPWDSSTLGSFADQGVDFAGGNQPHNNMPPYIALYFCQKS